MRKLSVLVLLCPSLFACDAPSSDELQAELRANDAVPTVNDGEGESKAGAVMTCAEILEPAVATQFPFLEMVAPGTVQFPPMNLSCEELLEEPSSDASHGQAICSWKVADAIGMEIDALNFTVWENDEGETVCGCVCPRCQGMESPAEEYNEIGEGTVESPFELYTKEQLADLGMHKEGWGAHYLQCDDIDLAPYYGEGGQLFTIGNNAVVQAVPFSGSYDGDDWEIKGFQGGQASPANVEALFSHTNQARLENINMIEPNNVFAGLVHRAFSTQMRNISVEGGIAGAGIVSWMADGSLEDSFADISTNSGGALGAAYGEALVKNVAAYGSVGSVGSAGPNFYAGGLASSVYGNATIQNCEAHGDVTSTMLAGGLIADVYGNAVISHSFATGNVTANSRAGGLVGRLREGTIAWSYATGDVVAESEHSRAGGLVGAAWTELNSFHISNSYALGDVTGGAASGLVTGAYSEFIEPGTPLSFIRYCYAGGDVKAIGPVSPQGDTAGYAGGLTSFWIAPFDPFVQPPAISKSFSLGTPTSNDDPIYAHMVGPAAWGNAFNIEAQTGNQVGGGTSWSLSNGDFQNPSQPPLSMDWVEGPDAWDFSGPLPTIPSAGAN